MGYPIAAAMSQTISHSSLPVRVGITGRTRLMRRSALVKVPSFSRKEVPGRKTCAYLRRLVEEEVLHDESSIDASAARTWLVLGSDWAMSSPWT